MANSDSSKGNPASKRMGNPARKARRSASWQRSEKRHAANLKAQQEREKANRQALEEERGGVAYRAAGGEHKRPSKRLRQIRRAQARAFGAYMAGGDAA